MPGYHGEYTVNDCGWTISGILYDIYNFNTSTWEGETSQGLITHNEVCDATQQTLDNVRIISAEYLEFQNGTAEKSDRTLISYEGLLLGIKDDENYRNFQLKQNYPNPFNPSTKIEYSVPKIETTAPIQLKVYDILGNDVATLVDEVQSHGEYSVIFTTEALKSISNGIYYYKLQLGDMSVVKKMIIVK
jgi:hypothetical protein